MPGCCIAENVELVRLLGRGGMGSVWLGRHRALNVDVAVKFIDEGHDRDANAVARFLREARALARVDSPHVVRVLDAAASGSGTERPYMILELLSGETLDSLLARRGPLSFADTVSIVRQIGSALDAAHAAGVIHRDVKPENVFVRDVDGEPFVKVLDFGISVYEHDPAHVRITSTGQTFGTPAFMSPEQMVCAKAVDSACDVWALAVVAYVCATGRLPFDGETFGAVCLEVHRRNYEPPSRLRAELPEAVDAFFRRAFHHDCSARFASGHELARALSTALFGSFDRRRRADDPPLGASATGTCTTLGGTAMDAPKIESLRPPVSPRPRRSMSLGIALAAVAAVSAMVIFTTRRGAEPSSAVSAVPLTNAVVFAPTNATANGRPSNEQMTEPRLVPPNEAHTTSATVFIAEGSDPDLPVQASDDSGSP